MASSWEKARRGIGQAADDRDQRRLAGAVGAEQREDLALLDIQRDGAERRSAGLVDLREVPYRDDGRHGPLLAAHRPLRNGRSRGGTGPRRDLSGGGRSARQARPGRG